MKVVRADDAQCPTARYGNRRRVRPGNVGGTDARRASDGTTRPFCSVTVHRGIRRGRRGLGFQSPVPREVLIRRDRPLSRDLIDEELPNLFLLVVHDRRALQHGIAAATRLTIVVERERERVGIGDGLPLH